MAAHLMEMDELGFLVEEEGSVYHVRDVVNVLPFPGRRVPCYIDGLQARICVQVVEEIYILEEKKYKR